VYSLHDITAVVVGTGAAVVTAAVVYAGALELAADGAGAASGMALTAAAKPRNTME